MRFHVLGPLEVIVNGEALPLGARQQQKLLALLCTSPNSPIHPDRLVDELWGETPPRSAQHLVQVYVSRLRKLLTTDDPGSRIVRTDAGYLLRVGEGEMDALQLQSLAGANRSDADGNASVVWQTLQEATGLWRGRPHGDLADESELLRSHAVSLTELYLGIVEERIDAGLELGYHQELVAELDALTAAHPYRERMWQQLMLALYRSERQVEALRASQALRRTLGEDLGLEPSPASADLERSILLHDPGLLWEPPAPPSNLPVSLTSFVGRATEVAEVTKLIDTSRIVTLTGPGGIGKTRLAIEAARRVRERFRDGLWWIDLALLAAGDDVVPEVARVLDVAAQPGKTLTDTVVQSLLRRQALLVMDNCEHLADAVAAFLADALRVAEGVQVLSTSRMPLHVPGETIWIVPSMSMPDATIGAMPELPYSDATELLVERGTAVAPWFRLDRENGPDIVAICSQLDGMPLAIEMAATHLRIMTPAEIAGALGNRFDMLVRRDRDQTPRHETLQAAIDWSYELLSPELQAAFDNLAVFPGSFSLDAAIDVAFSHIEQVARRDTMTALVESSMVATLGHEGAVRFRLLETLREYGLTNLGSAGRLDQIRTRHAEYFIELLSPAVAEAGEPGFVDWIARFADSYSDVQQAMDCLFEIGRDAEAAVLAPALLHYWYRTGSVREALRWGNRILEADEGLPPALRSAAHGALAFAGTILADDPSEAIVNADRATALGRNSVDQRGLVIALFGRANAALLVGDFDTLRDAAVEGLDVSEQIGYEWGRGACLSQLAFWHFFGRGSLQEARDNSAEAVSIFRTVGDVASQVVLNLLSAIALQQGDIAAAERYALDTAAVASGTGWEAPALVNLADVYLAQDELERADITLRRAVVRALETGTENWFRMALRNMAQLALKQGDGRKAARMIGASKRNMPAWGLDPGIYAAVEAGAVEMLGRESFDEASRGGFQLQIDELLADVL